MHDEATKKTIIVTGASRGIGKYCALTLANAGFHVLAAMRSKRSIEEFEALNKKNLSSIQLDITDSDSICSISREFEQKPIHGLVNNAGTAVLGPLEFIPIKEIRQQFEVNFFGQIAVTQAFLPHLRAAKGRIINISSISGFIGFPYFGAYASSKFALEGFSDSLRRELKRFGITVSVVQPGNIDTDIWRDTHFKGKKLEDQFPEEALHIYGKRFSHTPKKDYGPSGKSSPNLVAKTVLRALTDSKPRCRYLVGKDAYRYKCLRKILPDSLLDRFI